MRLKGTIFALLFGTSAIAQQTDLSNKDGIMIIHDCDKPRQEKEALIILSGLGDSRKGRKCQKVFFDTVGYDLYLPFYLQKTSFKDSYNLFESYYEKKKLSEYKKLHVFSYILGSWVINTHILEHGYGNISTIVYDRSPLQERAPRVIVEKIPLIGRLAAGRILADFSEISYPEIVKTGEARIGIIVESKATVLIRRFKETAMSYGPIDWANPPINQAFDDLTYTHLNHTQMYTSFDIIGAEIMHFIRNGNFSRTARRIAYNWDPMEKYKAPKNKEA